MIWFDVTEVKNWEGHHTGIQRVITKIGLKLNGKEDFGLCYFDYSTNTFRVYEHNFEHEIVYTTNNNSVKTKVNSRVRSVVGNLKKRAPEKLKNSIKRIVSIGGTRHDAVKFKSHDVLFIPGAFWVYSFKHLQLLKENHGISIAGIMYDLVPIVTPQFTAKVTIDGFNARFIQALDVFDHWFAISDNTKNDMLSAAKQRGTRLSPKNVDVIRLGADEDTFSGAAKEPENIRLIPNKFALFVSTIEARKNQTLVYHAVKNLQQKSIKHLPIVLVGKHGWLSDDIIYILRNDTTISKSLIWLDKVDDNTLRWLYENCAFTIYPSYYEGWGLPVAESLTRGKACIASNTSSIPEVARDLIEYFSPYSSDELSDLIQKYSEPAYLKTRNTYVRKFIVPTWINCAEQVFKSLSTSVKR